MASRPIFGVFRFWVSILVLVVVLGVGCVVGVEGSRDCGFVWGCLVTFLVYFRGVSGNYCVPVWFFDGVGVWYGLDILACSDSVFDHVFEVFVSRVAGGDSWWSGSYYRGDGWRVPQYREWVLCNV